MKTITIANGHRVEYAVMQEDNMEVTAAKVDEENVANFGAGVSLGVLGDINDLQVRDIIIAKLYPIPLPPV